MRASDKHKKEYKKQSSYESMTRQNKYLLIIGKLGRISRLTSRYDLIIRLAYKQVKYYKRFTIVIDICQ